jgi:glycosyltransferase involved in cell wall biosynthesis
MGSLAYVYPPVHPTDNKEIQGSYLVHFVSSLSSYFDFINLKDRSRIGIFDLLYHLFRIDYLFLNWVENLPDKKGGRIQAIGFLLLAWLARKRGVKMVWVMHNKVSHYHTNIRLKTGLFCMLVRRSDLIITHSRDGIEYLKEFRGADIGKVHFCHHPLEKKFLDRSQEPGLDLLLWGSIIPYKGIDRFLAYLHEKGLAEAFRIVIAGKVKPPGYEDTIKQYCSKTIRLDNRYIPEEELHGYLKDTKRVLFTYLEESVLSSGALMETLAYGVGALGNHVGAFKDLQEDGIIQTYQDFDQLLAIMNEQAASNVSDLETIGAFIEENTWKRFAERVDQWIRAIDSKHNE